MKKQYYKVGVVGATGMVGQRFVTLLEHHPWFKLTVVAASGRSAGKTYAEAVGSRWAMTTPMPESVKEMVVQDAAEVKKIAAQVDFIFCAVNMPKNEIKALEEAYAKAECPVVSNNSAHRFTPDVPMVVPEINADHIDIIPAQRRRLGSKRGFIAVKSNCSLQSYVPAFHPLMKDFGVTKALVCTYQAISGAGKTFDRMPEIIDNVIPYIGGEEEKSEQEPLKLWGHIEGDRIVNAEGPVITAQCFRVPVSDGHTAAVFVSFAKKPTKEQILEAWKNFRGPAQELELPSAPKQFLHYFEENDRPQPKLDRNTENGMAVCTENTHFSVVNAPVCHRFGKCARLARITFRQIGTDKRIIFPVDAPMVFHDLKAVGCQRNLRKFQRRFRRSLRINHHPVIGAEGTISVTRRHHNPVRWTVKRGLHIFSRTAQCRHAGNLHPVPRMQIGP